MVNTPLTTLGAQTLPNIFSPITNQKRRDFSHLIIIHGTINKYRWKQLHFKFFNGKNLFPNVHSTVFHWCTYTFIKCKRAALHMYSAETSVLKDCRSSTKEFPCQQSLKCTHVLPCLEGHNTYFTLKSWGATLLIKTLFSLCTSQPWVFMCIPRSDSWNI